VVAVFAAPETDTIDGYSATTGERVRDSRKKRPDKHDTEKSKGNRGQVKNKGGPGLSTDRTSDLESTEKRKGTGQTPSTKGPGLKTPSGSKGKSLEGPNVRRGGAGLQGHRPNGGNELEGVFQTPGGKAQEGAGVG